MTLRLLALTTLLAATIPAPARADPGLPAHARKTAPTAPGDAPDPKPDSLPPQIPEPPPPPPSWYRPVGWPALGIGMTLAAVGAWMVVGALSDGDELQRKLDMRDDAGLVVGIRRDEAVAERDRIDRTTAIGSGIAVAGVVAAAVGSMWLAADSDARLTLAPTCRGLIVTARF